MFVFKSSSLGEDPLVIVRTLLKKLLGVRVSPVDRVFCFGP